MLLEQDVLYLGCSSSLPATTSPRLVVDAVAVAKLGRDRVAVPG